MNHRQTVAPSRLRVTGQNVILLKDVDGWTLGAQNKRVPVILITGTLGVVENRVVDSSRKYLLRFDAHCAYAQVDRDGFILHKETLRLLEYPLLHQKGVLDLENQAEVMTMLKAREDVDVGIQVSYDGRIWLCVNGMAFIRFKPRRDANVRNTKVRDQATRKRRNRRGVATPEAH